MTLQRYRQGPWTIACVILATITALGLWPNQILWRFAVQALVNVLLFDWAADFTLTVLEPNGALPAATSHRLILIPMLSALWVGITGLILGSTGLLRFETWYGLAFLWVGLARLRKSTATGKTLPTTEEILDDLRSERG